MSQRKKILYLFTFLVFALTGLLIQFIQSETFVKMAMKVAVRYIPKNSGINAEFSHLEIHLFPPGVSINDAKVSFGPENIARIPGGASFDSKRMGVFFHPLQLLSRDLRAQLFEIEDGKVSIELRTVAKEPKDEKKENKTHVVWDQLLKLRFEGVSLKNTVVDLGLPDEKIKVHWTAERFNLRQELVSGAIGYGMDLAINDLQLTDSAKNRNTTFTGLKVSGIASPRMLRLSNLEVQLGGISLSATGQVDGDILSSPKLPTLGEIKLNVDIAKGYKLLEWKENVGSPSGELKLMGKVSADLKDLKESLLVSGKLGLKNAKYKGWAADSVNAETVWEPMSDSWLGKLQLQELVVEGAPAQRVPGESFGFGGKVSIKEVTVQANPLRVSPFEIELEKVHPHWLLGDAAKDIYPLDFRVTGNVGIVADHLESKSEMLVQTDLNLGIDSFVLDNQRKDEKRALSQVFSIPKLRLVGKAKIDSEAFSPLDVSLKVNESEFRIGGSVNFKNGYGLIAKGEQFDLKDIGSISGTKIFGKGNIDLHVHGPSSDVKVDLDLNLKEANYLNLNLGSLKGKIAYWDAQNQIVFTQVELLQGATAYIANGVLDVGKVEKANLDFVITKGDFQDLTEIFNGLVKQISWYPVDLAGNISGTVAVRGGLRMSELIVKADLKFKDAEYKGERFHHGRLIGGYDQGDYSIEKATLVKQRQVIEGSIFYSDRDGINWGIATAGLDLNEMDWIGSLDLPIRGGIDFYSKGSGRFGSLNSQTSASIRGLTVRGVPYPDSSVKIVSQKGNWKINADLLRGMGKFDLNYDFNPLVKSKVSLKARRFDFSPLIMILNSKLVNDMNLKSYVTGSLDVDFQAGKFELGDGQFTIEEYLVKRQGHQVALAEAVRTELKGGNFDYKTFKITGLEGDLILKLKSGSGKLEGELKGEADLGLFEYVTSVISNCTGVADLDLKISGSIKEPNMVGKVEVNQGEVRITSLESPLENIQSLITIEDGLFTIERFNAGLARGDVSAKGTVELFTDTVPEIDLGIKLRESQIKVYPFQNIKLTGNMSIQGNELPYLISGDLSSDAALAKEEFGGGSSGFGSNKVSTYMPGTLGSGQNEEESLFDLKINVRADRGVLVKNSLMDAEWSGKFTVVGNLEAPRAVGEANLIQGKLFFKDRQFTMQSGKVTFDNPTQINPRFSILSFADLNKTKINLSANGRLNEWKLDLTSNPSLPPSEILSLLSLGFTSEELSRQASVNRSTINQTEAATVVLNSLNFNKDLESKTGFQVQLNEAQSSQIGNSLAKAQGTSDQFASPKIVIRRRIGDNLSLSVGSTVGVGTNQQKEVNAEYSLSDNLSFQGVFNDFQIQSPSISTRQTSYGADFKIQRRFK